MADLQACGKCAYFGDCRKLLHVERETQRRCVNFRPRRSKMRNEKVAIDGITFDSKKEAARYQELKLMLRARVITGFERQVEFELQSGFVKNGVRFQPIIYRADFKVSYPDGHIEIEDVKAADDFKDKVYRIKRKLFEFRYPGLTIKEIY